MKNALAAHLSTKTSTLALTAFALASSLVAPRAARAAVTATCYQDKGRVVDAAPLSGTMRSTNETLGALKYLQYLPKGHDPAKKWPVIIFMHGSGEASDNGSIAIITKHSLPRVVEDPAWNWPFIVISPQIDKTSGWLSHAAELGAVLDKVQSTYGGDPNRIYLSGLSYGGVGTYALGIAMANRVAALMPVTPGGGGLSNWDQRAKIVNLPIWHFHGKIDGEYAANVTRISDLEASGASKFFRYDYAFTDEYNDVVPKQALAEKHIFGTYENIMHDVWYATYGTFCTTPSKEAAKTTQYLWLLSQSRDGSAYVDPRGANGIDGGGVPAADGGGITDGGTTDASTSTGTAGAGTAGSSGTAGTSGSTGAAGSATGAAGATGQAGSSGAAGSTTGATGGSAGATGAAGTYAQKSTSSGGCSYAATSASSFGVAFAVALFGLALRPRRRRS